MNFRWNTWNVEHIGEHGVSSDEAQYIVEHPARPYPQYVGDGRYLVRGQTSAGEYVQVSYIFSPPKWSLSSMPAP